MMTVYLVLSAIGGGGLSVAFVNAWSQIKLKRTASPLDERAQFIKELNDLRTMVSNLYTQYYQILEENSTLKLKVKDLEDHVSKKSLMLKELGMYKGYHDKLKELVDNCNTTEAVIFIEKVKNLVSEYELSSS